MNGPLIGVWIFILLFVIILISLSISGMVKWRDESTFTIESGIGKCEPELSTLPDVSELRCCLSGNILTPNKYYPELDMVIGPAEISYFESCSGFCKYGVNDSNPLECISVVGQSQYTECINNLRPINCTSRSRPIARVGITYYYGVSATNQSCLVGTRPC